jgi:chaperonin GroEL
MAGNITDGEHARQALLRGVAHVKTLPGNEGCDAQTEVYEDLVAAGVIDPTKVVRSAPQNAASIASLLLTTEAVVSHLPDEAGQAAPAGGF